MKMRTIQKMKTLMKMKRHLRRYVHEICILYKFYVLGFLNVDTLNHYNIFFLIFKAVAGKKRPTESATKTPVPAKKAKGAATPQTGNVLVAWSFTVLCY